MANGTGTVTADVDESMRSKPDCFAVLQHQQQGATIKKETEAPEIVIKKNGKITKLKGQSFDKSNIVTKEFIQTLFGDVKQRSHLYVAKTKPVFS